MKLIDKAYQEAVKVLKKNSTPKGFKASAKLYNSVWARDSGVAILGVVLTKDKQLLKTCRKSLETLRKGQTKLGQIPYKYVLDEKRYSHYALDSNLWFIIGCWQYFRTTADKKFLAEFWFSLKKAMLHSNYQVIDRSGLLDHPESVDWMDSSIGRSGKVLYSNSLFYKAMACMKELAVIMGEKQEFDNIDQIKKRINMLLWPENKGKKYLASENSDFFDEGITKWRNHYIDYLSFEYFENRCDVWANLMTILFGIANKEKTKKILDYMERKIIDQPYPVRVLWPPALYHGPTWNPKVDLYREEQHRNKPFCYHNAGIWPFIGGFYVLTLVKAGRKAKARKVLKKLAELNRMGRKNKWEFNEWFHGKTAEPRGAAYQTWSAAGYIIAYQAVKGNLIF